MTVSIFVAKLCTVTSDCQSMNHCIKFVSRGLFLLSKYVALILSDGLARPKSNNISFWWLMVVDGWARLLGANQTQKS
jgi:hypothetical protein